MSRHHRAQKWTSKVPGLRAKITPTLPRRCLNCPHLVTPDQKWQVGHVRPASKGGKASAANTGPTHAYCPACGHRCNQVDGGRLGAAVTNSRRQARKDIRPW